MAERSCLETPCSLPDNGAAYSLDVSLGPELDSPSIDRYGRHDRGQSQAVHAPTGWTSRHQAKERGTISRQNSWRPWGLLKSSRSTKVVEIPSPCGAELTDAGAIRGDPSFIRDSKVVQQALGELFAATIPGCADLEEESTDDGSSATPVFTDSDLDVDELLAGTLSDDEVEPCLDSNWSLDGSPDVEDVMTAGEPPEGLSPKAKARMGRLTRLVNRFVPKVQARKAPRKIIHQTPVEAVARQVD